ncbi:MAG: hypothetical protein RLZZ224_643, partial [Verrucomicrobiota bacterium]
PNPEVKRFSANGSETIGLVRVGRRQVYAPHFGNKVRGSFFAVAEASPPPCLIQRARVLLTDQADQADLFAVVVF